MPRQIVLVAFAYESPSPEEAEAEVRETESRYEGESVVVAASSLGELPHVSQLPQARELFGE